MLADCLWRAAEDCSRARECEGTTAEKVRSAPLTYGHMALQDAQEDTPPAWMFLKNAPHRRGQAADLLPCAQIEQGSAEGEVALRDEFLGITLDVTAGIREGM